MVNIIWGIFIVIGIVYSFVNGNFNEVNNEVLLSGKSALDLIWSMTPLLVIWMGLMKIAEDAGVMF